eukprot:PhM_4_TR17995/c0_g2_i1/m.23975
MESSSSSTPRQQQQQQQQQKMPVGLLAKLRTHYQNHHYESLPITTLLVHGKLPPAPDYDPNHPEDWTEDLQKNVEEFYRCLYPLYGSDSDKNVQAFKLGEEVQQQQQNQQQQQQPKKRSRSRSPPTAPISVSEDPFEAYRKRAAQQARQQREYGGPMRCSYHKSREGCKRGQRCPYLHD